MTKAEIQLAFSAHGWGDLSPGIAANALKFGEAFERDLATALAATAALFDPICSEPPEAVAYLRANVMALVIVLEARAHTRPRALRSVRPKNV